MKIETPKNAFIDEFICLRSKAYSYKCGSHIENRLKGISKPQSRNIISKNITIVYLVVIIKKNDNYIIKSINHEMYLQKVRKSTL